MKCPNLVLITHFVCFLFGLRNNWDKKQMQQQDSRENGKFSLRVHVWFAHIYSETNNSFPITFIWAKKENNMTYVSIQFEYT